VSRKVVDEVCQKLMPEVFDKGSIFLGLAVSVHVPYQNLNLNEVLCGVCGG
jgi:hypothetical protein